MSLIIFTKEYSGEEWHDVDRDVSECIDGRFNPAVENIPVDEWGLAKGILKVTVEWIEEE